MNFSILCINKWYNDDSSLLAPIFESMSRLIFFLYLRAWSLPIDFILRGNNNTLVWRRDTSSRMPLLLDGCTSLAIIWRILDEFSTSWSSTKLRRRFASDFSFFHPPLHRIPHKYSRFRECVRARHRAHVPPIMLRASTKNEAGNIRNANRRAFARTHGCKLGCWEEGR